MNTPWWWYPFLERQTTNTGRGMRAPTRSQLKRLRELEAELDASGPMLGKDLLYCAVHEFIHSRDGEEGGKDPWDGITSMWDFFLSEAQLPVWLLAGSEYYPVYVKYVKPKT
jgi:hypothetical protein